MTQIDTAIAEAIHELDWIHTHINNARLGLIAEGEEISENDMRCLFHTTIFGVMNVIQVALPHMLKQRSGQVINISSTSGYRFSAGFGVYFATKFAVEGLSDALYESLSPQRSIEPDRIEPHPYVSTAGGLKIFRFQVVGALLVSSLKQLLHTRAVIRKKYNGHPVNEELIRSLLTFSFFFTITIAVIALGLSWSGWIGRQHWAEQLLQCATWGQAWAQSSGPLVTSHISMLLGRLEILTVLILTTPVFWRY